nr:circularly permuted type 2 ATP-grasp protein [Sphingomonadaceae bacterium]
AWSVMPGGFARIGERLDARAAMMGDGAFSADVSIVCERPVAPVTLMPSPDAVVIRRNPGTLPSRVADNLFWLGRYLERAEAILALVRGGLGGSTDVDGGAALAPETRTRLANLLITNGAAAASGGLVALAIAAFDGPAPSSVRTLMRAAREIGEGSRDRLSADVWRLLDAPFPQEGSAATRAAGLHERLAALSGLSAENMGRTAGWRFLDLGKRIERGVTVCRAMRVFASENATADDLTLLLELTNSQIGYRQRYPTGIALVPVRDLVALDAGNPRSLAFQVEAIVAHLSALPRLSDDGLAELQQVEAVALAATLTTLGGWTLGNDAVHGIEDRLLGLSDAIGRRFFLRGGAPLRASGMTLA